MAATVSADVVALVAASVLAVWIVTQLHDVPLIHQLARPLRRAMPRAACWPSPCSRRTGSRRCGSSACTASPARSIGGFNLGESFSGLTALTSSAWVLLIVLVLALGDAAPVVMLIAFWFIAIVAAARGPLDHAA